MSYGKIIPEKLLIDGIIKDALQEAGYKYTINHSIASSIGVTAGGELVKPTHEGNITINLKYSDDVVKIRTKV